MSSTDYEEQTEQEIKLKRPNLWRVIFHNDDKTTMEFVVFLLLKVFHKSEQEAVDLMLEVHEKGAAIVGVYTHEIAENKMEICINTAVDHKFPLRVTIEEES